MSNVEGSACKAVIVVKGLLRIHLWCPDDLPMLWDRIEKNSTCVQPRNFHRQHSNYEKTKSQKLN